MNKIGFSKLTLIGKIKVALHLLGKSYPKFNWQIQFNNDLVGSIGYMGCDGWEYEYPFSNEHELDMNLLAIYEELVNEEK